MLLTLKILLKINLYLLFRGSSFKKSRFIWFRISFKRESTRVENGVGVVQYGVLNRNELMEKFNKLENEVNSLSEKIDNVNSKTEIEVKLLSSTD